MKPEDIAEELRHPGARELLDTATLLRIAYNGSDGFPRVVPTGFYWDGSRIVICTATTAPKVAALLSRPEVALTIDIGDTPADAKQLQIRGVAAVEVVDGVADEYLQAAKKAMDGDEFGEFDRNVRSFYKEMARIAVEPQWVRYFDFGVGRIPRFLQDIAREAHVGERDEDEQ